MGMTDKVSLINQLTLTMVEDYNLNLREVKAKVQEILQHYHVTISEENDCGDNTDTDYLFKKFSDSKSSVGMADKTIKQYRIAIEKLELITGKKLADVEADDMTRFLKEYGKIVSSVTLRAKYQLLSSVYNFLFLHKHINYNPIAYVEPPKMTVKYKTPITDCDVEKLKVAVEKLPEKESVRDMAILHFFMSTGCRVSEVVNIKIKDMDFEKMTCTVMGKGRKQRPVALTDKAIFRLKLYLSQRKNLSPDAPLFASLRGDEVQITSAGMERIIRKLKDKSGVDFVTCHSFRRYYATDLRKRNVPIQMIASSLGHANLNQINRYSLYNSSEMLDSVRNAM